MYDDLLGEKKKKTKNIEVKQSNVLNIGSCGQCSIAEKSKIHRRSQNIYCPELKKYVHASQHGCLKFKRLNGKNIILA
jgi:hypothetical protein